MIRVVADANVLVSAAITRDPNSPPAVILDAVLDGRVELVTSPALLVEIGSVLARPRMRRYLSLDRWIEQGRRVAEAFDLATVAVSHSRVLALAVEEELGAAGSRCWPASAHRAR